MAYCCWTNRIHRRVKKINQTALGIKALHVSNPCMFHDNDTHVCDDDVNPFHQHCHEGENYELSFHLPQAHDIDLIVDVPELKGRI